MSAILEAPLPRRAAPRARVAALVAIVLALSGVLGLVAAYAGPLGLAALACLVAGAAIVRSPERVTPLVLAAIYANVAVIGIKFYGAPQMAALLPPLLLVVPLAAQVLRRTPIVVTPVLLMLVALLVVQVVSGIASEDVAFVFERIKSFFIEAVVLFFLVTNVLRNASALRAALWAVVLAGAFAALLAVCQYAFGMYESSFGGFAQVSASQLERDQPRVGGPIGEKNYFAQILIVLVPLAVALVQNEARRLLRVVAAAAGCVIAAGVVLTFSRGAAIAFVAMLIVSIAFGYLRLRSAFAILAVVAALLLSIPGYAERVLSIRQVVATTQEGGQSRIESSIQGRSSEMKTAANVFSDHPVIGVGPGLFPRYYREYADALGVRVHNEDRYAHNLYLQMGAELGLLGLGIFLFAVGYTLVSLTRARRQALAAGRTAAANVTAAFFSSLVAFLVTAMFLTLAFERYFWLLLALAGAATLVAMREARAHAPARSMPLRVPRLLPGGRPA